MLFKRLFSKKKEPEQEALEIKLEEVEEWLRKENLGFMENLEKEINQGFGILEERFSGMRQSFEDFRAVEIHPEVMERLKKAAQTNKTVIEKSLQNFIESFSIPQEKDFKSAYNFCENVSGKIAELGKKNRRGFLIVSEAMREDTKNLKKGVGDFEEELLKLWSTLKEKGKRVNSIEEAVNLSKSIKSKIDRRPKIEKEIKNLEDALDFQNQKMKKARKELDEFGKNKEMIKLKEMEREKEELQSKKSKVEERIVEEILRFEKAFKKIYHGNKSKVNDYMESPLETLMEQDGLKKFKEIISSVKNSIQKNEFDLSEKVRDKTILEIERVESGVLDWILKEHKDLTDKISDLSKKIEKNKAVAEREAIEKDYDVWKQAVSITEKKIMDLRREAEGIRSKIDSERELLERKLKIFSDREVHLKESSLL